MMIDQLKEEYPIQVICDVIGYSRSRYYYQPRTEKESEEEALKKAISLRHGFAYRERSRPISDLRLQADYEAIAARRLECQSQTCQPTDARARTTREKKG